MRGINWDNVKCFIVTARAGSLTVAANTLKMSPATLSRRLANLEHECGTLLFARTPTGYNLTRDGQDMLAKCAAIEEGFSSLVCALEGVSKEPSGTVRVALSENIANLVLIPRLDAFRKAYPMIDVEFRIGVQPIALHTREADIAIRVSIPKSGPFKARVVGTLYHGLYLGREIDPNGANSDSGIIGWSDDSADLPIARAAASHAFWRKPMVRVSTLQGHIAAARAGHGYAYLPCLVGDRHADLTRVEGPEGLLRQDIYLILHDDSIAVPRVRAVADFIVDAMRDAAPMFR